VYSLSVSQVKAIQGYLEQAKTYAKRGEWQTAINCYQQATAVNPNNPNAYHQWGDALINLQRWEEAVELYHRALAINPHLEWSQYNLGEVLSRLERWEEAIVAYQKAFDLNPNLPNIYKKLADAFYQRAMRDREELLAAYLQEIQANPNEIKNYHQAIELQPQNAELYLKLGNALVANQKLDEAIVTYQMALQLQPEYFEAQQQLNKILNSRNHHDQPSSQENKLAQAKQVLDNLNQIALNNFLLTNGQIIFPSVEKPIISIILVLYNRAELTFSCLSSILQNNFKSLEVIIVDNNSTDLTRQLLKKIVGAKIIFNDQNNHFLLASNQASQIAQGKYLLFLNNDAQILGDSLNAAINTIQSSADIGAVGGKIILPDGTLQEAGSIIWQDGSCLGYGRGDQPEAPQYMFKRTVDYCSGAFLLTSRELFEQLGRFDPIYQPAYYEETDYCVKLHKAGKKIIYDPDVIILHYEFASSTSSSKAIELQQKNQQIFIEQHQDWLKSQYQPETKNILFARTSQDNRRRILFIDDRIPHPYLGSGYTRSHCILNQMVALGYFVTFYPTDTNYSEEWNLVYSDIHREVEIIPNYGLEKLEKFLFSRAGYYDIIFVSRPHNMNHLNYILSQTDLLRGEKIIYDAEALYSLRQIAYKQLKSQSISEREQQKLITEELELARKSDLIISVSSLEQQRFLDYGYQQVTVLGHSLAINPTPNNFSERQNILFVGSIYVEESPNADSILWLVEEIFPLIQSYLNEEIQLLIAGNNQVENIKQHIAKLNNPAIKILGKVDNLPELYNQTRLFIAPTRFAAGIPHKVHEAAAYGLPIVTTSLIATQLKWTNATELLIADSTQEFANQCINLYQNAQLWQNLRVNALKKIEVECSPEYFTQTLKTILE
jgi:GT2 family glycosyltransferase/Flp pilus assembly protein TadD